MFNREASFWQLWVCLVASISIAFFPFWMSLWGLCRVVNQAICLFLSFTVEFYTLGQVVCCQHILASTKYRNIYYNQTLNLIIFTFDCLFEIIFCQNWIFMHGGSFNHIIISPLIWLNIHHLHLLDDLRNKLYLILMSKQID